MTHVDASPWLLYDSASVSPQSDSEDWLSFFDFPDFQLSSSTQEADVRAPLPDFDTSDLLSPRPPFLYLYSDCEKEERIAFSSIFELNGQTCSNSPIAVSENVNTVAPESANAYLLPPQIHSPSLSSLNDSDAGSSAAVREAVSFDKNNPVNDKRDRLFHVSIMKDSLDCSAASSRKRHNEDKSSDMDVGDKESRLETDPMDRRQQRLLRNRELAFESRQRKKCYISDLEARCRFLEQERNQLQQRLCLVSTENSVLKGELSRVKSFKQGKGGVTEPAVLFMDSLPLEFLSLLICLLLMALLSPCGSPSLAMVLKITLLIRSAIKRGGPRKEQLVPSERPSNVASTSMQWLVRNHTPLFLYGSYCTRMVWQVF